MTVSVTALELLSMYLNWRKLEDNELPSEKSEKNKSKLRENKWNKFSMPAINGTKHNKSC